ncbi:MAG: carbonic anhydrase [Acidobacteria bacterium]|nr:carbonic anhydrase [Acidobacteriota bacterium]
MEIFNQVIEANRKFVEEFTHHDLEAPPSRKLAIVTCMDARLSMERMLGLQPGEAHILRNAGGVITEDILRSLIVSNHLLGTRHVMIINHTECGMMQYTDDDLRAKLLKLTGMEVVAPAQFHTFKNLEDNVRLQIMRLKSHPWIPKDLLVKGYIYDVRTGLLSAVPDEAEEPKTSTSETKPGTSMAALSSALLSFLQLPFAEEMLALAGMLA